MRVHAVRPYQLMCLVCRLADSPTGRTGIPALDRLAARIRRDPAAPLRLRCHADGVYRYQNPGRAEDTPEGELYNEKRDLDILQRLGLVPGDTRPADELLERLARQIPSPAGICADDGAGTGVWQGCPRAVQGHYARGLRTVLAALVPPRPQAECAEVKTRSAAAMLAAEVLRLRPHHLMCMTCFHGGRDELQPIPQDNLFEAIEAIRRRPDIQVELVRGCCMICPPCASYEPERGLCRGGRGMSLRDQKKDLDVLQCLGLSYGARLPARELLQRLYDRIPSALAICGYGTGLETAPEWRVCGGPECNTRYARGRAAGLGVVTVAAAGPRTSADPAPCSSPGPLGPRGP